jgi:hypothetical protein
VAPASLECWPTKIDFDPDAAVTLLDPHSSWAANAAPGEDLPPIKRAIFLEICGFAPANGGFPR